PQTLANSPKPQRGFGGAYPAACRRVSGVWLDAPAGTDGEPEGARAVVFMVF
ncbi:hypothetical protein SAMN03159514_05381, partial [Kosakonia radicincitans]